jgi:hypothetical protein
MDKRVGLMDVPRWQSSCWETCSKPMPAHIPIDHVAERLNVTAEKLWELQGLGWISIVEKNGIHFIRGHHEYKAKFILHLQNVLKLTPQQISIVLLAEEPPYSCKDIDRILAENQAAKPTSKVGPP